MVTSGGVTTIDDYVYDGLTLLRSTSVTAEQTTTVEYLTDAEGRPYAAYVEVPGHAESVFVWIVTDARGDVLELLASDGTPLAFWRYTPYGEHAASEAQAAGGLTLAAATQVRDAVKLRFAGYSFDAESGLYYLSSRYYDPITAQFLIKDPARDDGEESAYQYCGGDPVNKVDPTGKVAWLVAAAAGGAAFDVGIYAYQSWRSGKKMTWKGTLGAAVRGAATGIAFGGIGKLARVGALAYKSSKIAKGGGLAGKGATRNMSVYWGRTSTNSKAYVGITKNVAKREKQHGQRFKRGLNEIGGRMSKGEARGVEQYLINKNGMLKSGGKLQNARSEIAKRRSIYKPSVSYGRTWYRSRWVNTYRGQAALGAAGGSASGYYGSRSR